MASRRTGGAESAVPVALVVVLTAAAITAVSYDVLAHRLVAGTDRAAELAPILSYLGVDPVYVLARSVGIAALFASMASVGCGLRAGQLRSAGRLPQGWLLAVHRQVSVLTLALTVAHAGLPYLSAFPPYGGWRTATVPFDQPVSWGTRGTVGESLGILALWLMLLVGPTYYLLGGRFRRLWMVAHRGAAAVYLLAVVHVLVLGSDVVVAGPVRAAFLIAQAPVAFLAARRLGFAGPVVRVGSGLLLGLAVLLVSAGLAGLLGAPLGGLRL